MTDDATPLQDDRSDAVLSEDGIYRYRLSRTWDVEKPTLAWVMLNPSTADASEDDPTIRRCIGYAEDWGFGGIVVGNLFALRATGPSELADHPEPVGPENGRNLREICEAAETVVAAWGANGDLDGRAMEVARTLDADLHCLDVTKAGHPVHPLYQPADAEPEPWDERALLARTDGGTDPTRTDRSELFDDEGQMWAGGPRDLQERLTEYYGVEDGQIWTRGDHYDEEQDEVLMDVLTYFDSDEEHLIADGVPQYGHGPSDAACVERDDLPSEDQVRDVVEEADEDGDRDD